MYSKLNSISSESFPLQGNPNLNPQISVNYEVGAKHQFHPKAAANVSFFVKDVYDYPASTRIDPVQGTNLSSYFIYLNGHFSRSKGFEVEVEKQTSNHWSGKLSYSYQQTKGKSSDPNEDRVLQEIGGSNETRLSEVFVRWNRPHKLSASFDLRFDKETPATLKFMKQTGLNLFVLVAGYGVTFRLAAKAMRMRGMRRRWPTLLSMPVYWLMISAAAWYALWQFATRPHFWNKTEHGLSKVKAPGLK